MRKTAALAVAATTLLAACSDLQSPVAAPGAPAPAFSAAGSDAVPGQYIVVLRDDVRDVPAVARQLSAAHGGSVTFIYEHALRGFAVANLSPEAAAALARNPVVAYVEQDQVYTTVTTTQSNATWGLDRIDQRARPIDGTYTYDTSASNVHAYIIDTGIRFSHVDFGGRVQSACYDAFGGNCNDGNGHGTHVAGTVGGATWGVAKGVQLYAVRVLDNNGSGTTTTVIAGVDWVTGRKNANPALAKVANMSLGGGASETLDNAVRRSIAAGVTYVVAAGNGDRLGRQQPACNYSPAAVREALTVGATTSTDAKTSWSNYGECVDIFAPGASITSAWHTSNTATNTISGTSMAAPHVAGVAALYLANNASASPAQVFQAVFDNATKGIVTSSSTANNHLLFSRFGGSTPPPPPANAAPTASFTFQCTELACNFTDTSSDSDGNIASWSWNFGDNTTSTAQNPARTYAAAGTYTVALTVTDNGGATASTSQQVTVTAPTTPPPSGFTLSAVAYKVSGRKHADLTWSGATSTTVDVFRDDIRVGTGLPNSGSWTHSTNERGGGSHSYRVCEAGTSTCSNTVTVTY
jgi:subtilisin family serine protease